jgi:transposase InsO family protein
MLQPLPVMGLFYRWSVDLCGPFPPSKGGNRYVMVMVEHFSKFVELAALPAKEARHTADAFKGRVLGRYGAMAEVLTDQGSEWLAEFHHMLEQALVDHRMTSAGRPSSNGASERVVQVVKQALRRRCHRNQGGGSVG